MSFFPKYTNDIRFTRSNASLPTVSYASFSGEGTPYLFPRLLSIILIVTTIVDLVANFKKGKQTKQISLVAVKQFLPGFILILLYVFLAEVVGFYLSSLLFLLFIIFAYRKPWQKKADTNRIKQAIFDILFSILFVVFIYLLFNLVLKVQAPRGLFL